MKIDDNLRVEYLNYLKLRLKKTTFDENKIKFDKYIYQYFKGVKIKRLNLDHIIEWKIFINNHNFKSNYNSNLYYILANFFDYLEKYKKLKCNYARKEGNFRNKKTNTNGKYWTIEEFNKFISNVNDEQYNILFRLLYFSGMRKGELLALTKKDIDFNNNTITINKSISKKHEIFEPKTESSNRIIHINNNLISRLKKYTNNLKDNDLVFDIPFTTLKRKKDYYCKISNVEQIKIHEFRHSHAIYLYTNKIPLNEIQHRLGHSDMSTTTDTYLKYLPNNEKRVIKLLNSVC